jgi:glutamine synthetase
VEQRTPGDVLKLAEDSSAEIVDLRFCDLPGLMQHFSMPIHELTEDGFEDGYGFDGSSIRGFQEIQESDMLLVPDPNTAVIDPFRQHATVNVNCFVKDPVTGEPYTRDPRYVAKKAEDYLKGTGIGDTAYFGPEAEFYIFDSARFDQNQYSAYYYVESVEGVWNSGAEFEPDGELNKAYKPRYKEGYFPVPPMDHFQDLRSEMILTLESLGVDVEVQHHEVGTAGQAEIDMRFDTLLAMADKLMLYKYVIKNVARRAGYTVTFMPKPIFEDNGSGMHTHQSIWKGGEPLFFDERGYGGISDMARWYIGGLLKHAHAILAFAAPTTNSYKRLVPGYEAPVNLVYSQRNRSACVRIPLYSKSPKAKRLEFRPPDPSCNPYLAFAAMLMAGLDGVQNRVEPPDPVDKDLYDLSPEEMARVPQVPGSLDESLAALEADHEFLLTGGVFTPDVVETWVEYKRESEIDAVRLRPHPWEFYLYYDI